MPNQSKNNLNAYYTGKYAFISFDTMLSVLPLIIMVTYTLNYAVLMIENNDQNIRKQVLHNKLVSIANLLVNELAAKKMFSDNSPEPIASIKPNWVDENELAKVDIEGLRKTMDLVKLDLHWNENAENEEDKKQHAKTCIYRLVVFGESREIRQLFVCGE